MSRSVFACVAGSAFTEGLQLPPEIGEPASDLGQSSTDSLPIGNLHLGTKTRLLQNAGYRTLGDVRRLGLGRIARLPSIGRRTVDDVVRNRDALTGAVTADGTVDWSAYCAATERPLIPAAGCATSGPEFLRSLPVFVEALIEQLNDDVLALILRERICQPPDRQQTLEEISAATKPKVTRERIRQREKKLLGQIAGGLLNDSYDGLDIHFHPEFSRWWRLAADALADQEEIGVASFVGLLSEIWSVPPGAIRAQLPAIVAIVTGEPQLTAGFRFVAKIDARLFDENCTELRQLPVLKLRLGKAALRLWEAGIEDIGGLLDRLGAGDPGAISSSDATKVTEKLNLIASLMSHDGRVDWRGYREALGMEMIPANSPDSALAFVTGLTNTIGDILRVHEVTKRATDILQLRTAQGVGDRMTLQQVGDRLGTFGSSIKREETDFLVWLNDVLIGGEFWKLDVWLDASWLAYWAEAETVFEHSEGDYDRFADNIAWRWRMSAHEAGVAIPILWAVLTGYPDKRRSTRQPVGAASGSSAPLGRIRLRGFRLLH